MSEFVMHHNVPYLCRLYQFISSSYALQMSIYSFPQNLNSEDSSIVLSLIWCSEQIEDSWWKGSVSKSINVDKTKSCSVSFTAIED